MNKALKNIGKMHTVTLIGNQSCSTVFVWSPRIARSASTPRGACARGFSIPVIPTPFCLLAMQEGSE